MIKYNIAFVVNEVAGGWEPTDVRLGGTEEAVVKWAKQLSDMGHRVSVFRNGRDKANHIYGYVPYLPRQSYWFNNVDVTINVKSSDFTPQGPTIYVTNELNAPNLDLSGYHAVVWPSQWAKDHIWVNNSNVQIIPYGYDASALYLPVKKSKQVLYASSPDRGLYDLLEVWPDVLKAHPDATLKVTYGALGESMKGVEFLGDVDEQSMNRLYRDSDIWCHPCTGVELFCISGLKAQAAACVPVYYPTMALGETVRAGIMTNHEMLTSDLIDILGDEKHKDEIRKELKGEIWPTWESTALVLLGLISDIV